MPTDARGGCQATPPQGADVISHCEPPDVGAGDRTQGPLEEKRVLFTAGPSLQTSLLPVS